MVGYELIDFGRGRKLERFGDKLIIRPAPGTEKIQCATPEIWEAAEASYIRKTSGENMWKMPSTFPLNWTTRIDSLSFELKPASMGQVGIFPEQLENWRWIFNQIQETTQPATLFNGFAYTGAATLFASSASIPEAPVTVSHVDASKSAVTWARKNAKLSGLEDNPVRWIVDDVLGFLKKEIKRGRTYDGFICDPPAFGRGPGGKTWKLSRDLPLLFELMAELLSDTPLFVIVSCHDPKITHKDLAQITKKTFPHKTGKTESFPMIIPTLKGRQFDCGSCARWSLRRN